MATHTSTCTSSSKRPNGTTCLCARRCDRTPTLPPTRLVLWVRVCVTYPLPNGMLFVEGVLRSLSLLSSSSPSLPIYPSFEEGLTCSILVRLILFFM
ncbi:unnamed protein product [Mesocestoides corti]|uniref:Uncharacterized protein n=1 Tax=Mesocestoides corti TaxID=53468 RepID=A0A0R3UGX5_MESCO|nr:unnamed protein product [Mesocestoides corti]